MSKPWSSYNWQQYEPFWAIAPNVTEEISATGLHMSTNGKMMRRRRMEDDDYDDDITKNQDHDINCHSGEETKTQWYILTPS